MELYDELLIEYEKYELDQIPRIMRFTKKKAKVVVSIMAAFILVAIILLIIFPRTQELVVLDTVSRTGGTYQSFPIATYNMKLIVGVILCAIPVVLLSAWMVLAIVLEKNAFKKASKSARDAVTHQRLKDYSKWQMNKMKRDF